MKKFVSAAALALAFVSSAVMAQTGVTGKWSFTATSPQGSQEVVFDLKSDAKGAITGMMTAVGSPMGELAISEGKITGKDVSFKVKIPTPQGAPEGFDKLMMGMTGKLDGDTLALNMNMEGMPAGMPAPPAQPIEAKRVKAAAAAPAAKATPAVKAAPADKK